MRAWADAFPPRTGMSDRGIEAPLEALAAARRLDWRFLLPRATLGRVAYIGSGQRSLPDALHRFAEELVSIPRGRGVWDAEASKSCDLAVVASRRVEDLREGFARLRPGGYLYWEVERRPRLFRPDTAESLGATRARGTGGFFRDPRRILHALGFDEVRVGLAFPDAAGPKIMLSPDPTAVRFALDMSRGRRFALDPLVSLASHADLLRLTAPSLRIVARRPGGENHRPGIAAATFLAERMGDARWSELPWLLLSRRAASFVVTFFLEPGRDRPAAVVKSVRLPRHEQAERALDQEARGLEAARARSTPVRSIPRILGRDSSDLSRHLALSGEPGRVIGRQELRRDRNAWMGTVVDWLIDLHRATRGPPSAAKGRNEKLVHMPMRQLELGLPDAEVHAEQIRRARHALETLLRLEVDTVLEHGDVCGSNVLTEGGRITVIDWELSEPQGFPGTDLFFFLASMALAREDARTWDEKLLAMEKAFRPSRGWAREWISEYWNALALPPEAAEPLFLCCWTRSLARLLQRPDKSLATAVEQRGSGVLVQHHFFRFWRYLLTSFEPGSLFPSGGSSRFGDPAPLAPPPSDGASR